MYQNISHLARTHLYFNVTRTRNCDVNFWDTLYRLFRVLREIRLRHLFSNFIMCDKQLDQNVSNSIAGILLIFLRTLLLSVCNLQLVASADEFWTPD